MNSNDTRTLTRAVDLAQLLEVLDTAKTILTRAGIQKVTLLADRGFADTALMTYLKALKWSFIIRIKASFGLYSPSGALLCKVGQVALRTGQSKHYHNVLMTKKLFGLVHVGLARVRGAKEPWFIVSDQPTSNVSFTIYGKRFDIEQVFKDDKSAGFDLEQSGLRDATKLGRLMTVLVIARLKCEWVKHIFKIEFSRVHFRADKSVIAPLVCLMKMP